MITKFQTTVSKELLKKIVKFFHPTLTEEQLDKIRWGIKYSWVTISFSVKDYGYISLGINNHEIMEGILFGPITKEEVKRIFKDKRVGYKIWRFVDDCLFEKDDIQKDNNVVFYGDIPLPSQTEFYNYYMKD